MADQENVAPVFIACLRKIKKHMDDPFFVEAIASHFREESGHEDVRAVLKPGKRPTSLNAELFFKGKGQEPYRAALRLLRVEDPNSELRRVKGCTKDFSYMNIEPHNQMDVRALWEKATAEPERVSLEAKDEPERIRASKELKIVSFDEMWKRALSTNGSVHPKLDECVERGKGGIRRAWAFDLPPKASDKGAPKRYISASASSFIAAYDLIPEGRRHAYEVIDAATPCFGYFDLEFSRNENADVDGDGLARRIADAAVGVLCARRPDLEVDVYFLDSSRDDKFSAHLILRTYEKIPKNGRALVPLARLEVAKALATETVEALDKDLDKKAIDRLVYTRNRCFRLIGSSKLGRKVALVAKCCLRYADGAVCEVPIGDDALAVTLVSPELGDGETGRISLNEIRRKKRAQPPAEEGRPAKKAIGHALDFLSDWHRQWRGATRSPLLDLAGLPHPYLNVAVRGSGAPPALFGPLAAWALEFVRREIPPLPNQIASICQWRYVSAQFPNEQYLHLTLRGTRYCRQRGRQHQSQNIVITVDPRAGKTWQRCWDKDDCCITSPNADGNDVVLCAKHALDDAPEARLPDFDDLLAFELLEKRRRPPEDASTQTTTGKQQDTPAAGEEGL